MRIVTDRVHKDEPCYGLQEVDRLIAYPDGSTRSRRIQAVYVVRGDCIAEYATDLGPSENFRNVMQLKLLSMGDDTVGECMEEAERSRLDTFERELRAEVVGTSTLIQDFIREKEENIERINNRSHFGPKHTKQRNGFDKRAALSRR